MSDRPTPADIELLSFAQRFELTVRDLYDAALHAGVREHELAGVFMTLREDHEAYANSMSGLLGVNAPQRRSDSLYDQLVGRFDTADVGALAAAAYELESVAAATHLDLTGRLEGIDGVTAVAALLTVEQQHCTVLADIAGRGDDLDALLTNTASSIAPGAAPPPAPGTQAPATSEPVATSAATEAAPGSSAARTVTPGTTEG
jgi:hypothetical protein